MHPSARLFSRGYTPLIKFIGKRTWPSGPSTPHAHPAGVPLPAAFSKSAPTPGSSGPAIFSEFWEAPKRFWMRELSKDEMIAIETGGASKW